MTTSDLAPVLYAIAAVLTALGKLLRLFRGPP